MYIDASKFGAVQHAFRAARLELEKRNDIAIESSSSQGTLAEGSQLDTPQTQRSNGKKTRSLARMPSFPNDAETVPLDYAHPISKYSSPDSFKAGNKTRKRESLGGLSKRQKVD